MERDAERYYAASVPALRGCHTQATSLDELATRLRRGSEDCRAKGVWKTNAKYFDWPERMSDGSFTGSS
ncbi:MAG TPA: type II toxin-antitoxin system HicB family antitoxin [Bacillota bacterium]|nr:type II toxin-antitoxin system HicB family antitoxin [Bacillota bacterium]